MHQIISLTTEHQIFDSIVQMNGHHAQQSADYLKKMKLSFHIETAVVIGG